MGPIADSLFTDGSDLIGYGSCAFILDKLSLS